VLQNANFFCVAAENAEVAKDQRKTYVRGVTNVPDLSPADVGIVQLQQEGGFSTAQMNLIMA
jgi:hypothetical protein